MTAVAYFEQIESARTPSDLFTDADKARSQYRRLARYVHPDRNGNDRRSHEAFERLGELWDAYNGKPHQTQPKRHAADDGTRPIYETKRYTFAVHKLLARGDIANVYYADYLKRDVDSMHVGAALKMTRSPKNNDLIANEITRLRQLREGVPEEFQMYHPTVVDSFSQRDTATGKTRRSVVLDYLDGFYSLRQVMDAYPTGVHPRHVAWMARRLWVAMDTAHAAGLVHGAVFPEHVMIHPKMHGVVLVDWCYSQEKGGKLTSAVPNYLKLGWYGKSYDKPLDHRLDVRQASHTLEALLGGQEVRPFRAFFNGCRVASAPSAGQLMEEFDDLLFRMYGKRKYVEFHMPDVGSNPT